MPLLPEIAELDAYRLEKDWTWEQLSAAMGRANIPMSPRTLHYLIKRAPADAKPLDRTLHKIRKFLVAMHEADRRRQSRQKAARRAAANKPAAVDTSASV